MSNLSTLPKGDSAWLLRKAIERIIQQVSVLETNIGSSTTGNSANTQIIFNDDGTLRGDAGLVYNKTTDALTVAGLVTAGSATITGDLTVDTNVLKVNTTTNRVGINTTTPNQNLEITGSGNPLTADGCSCVRLNNTVSGRAAIVGYDDSQNFIIWNSGTEVSETIKFLTGGGSGKEQYRITNGGVFTWYDGAGGTRMTLNSTGLGIGVSPSYAFQIKKTLSGTSTTVNPLLYLENNGAGNSAKITLTDGISNNGYIVYSNETGNSLLGLGVGSAQQLVVNASGNVGIGVTPSAWYTSYGTKAFQFAASGALYGLDVSSGDRRVGLLNNDFINTSGIDIYINTGHATKYQQAAGVHSWLIAPSGTAGNAITFTQAMTLDASGNLLTGTLSTGGSASNATKTVGGSFSTVNGVSASTATAVAVTLFTVPTEAVFIVSAFVPAYAAPTLYNAVSIVKVNGGVATVTAISTATNLSIAMSGLNVQATQLTGGASTISYSAIRIS